MKRQTSDPRPARRFIAALLVLALGCGMSACAIGNAARPDAASSPFTTTMNPEMQRLREQVIQNAKNDGLTRRSLKPEIVHELSSALQPDGLFSDLDAADHSSAFRRLRILGTAIATMPGVKKDADLRRRVYRGLIETSRREAASPTVFPRGAFEIPRAFLGTWFSLYDQMERDWQNPDLRPLLEELREVGGKVAFQAWVYPDHSPDSFRAENPLTIDVFRGQAHFIVANFVQYRSVLEYAVFLDDERYVDVIEEVARRSLHEPVHPADPAAGFWTEGIHPDRNMTAHGPQTYIFGYGRDYLNGILILAEYFEGGPHALSRAEFDVVANVILDGMVWFIYRNQMDYTVLGRHNLYPRAGIGGSAVALQLINRLLAVAGDRLTRKEELLEARARLNEEGEFSGSKYFWNTEEYVHRGEGFCVVVNINSTRTTGPEIVKPWAAQNFHFANGATMLYGDGTEYRYARGAWHFRALPGITAEFSEEPAPYVHTWNGMRGTEPFAGGVSDGEAGACAFVSAIEGVTVRANKAWFFHENTMVCLGSGIDAGGAEDPIRTTLNQTAWRSPIQVLRNGEKQDFPLDEKEAVEVALGGLAGVWHDQVSYVIEAGEGGLSAAVRATDWLALAELNGDKPAPDEAAVFDLFLDHGNAADASYAYAVRLGTTPEEMAASLESPEWRTLANTSAVQAVEFPEGRLVQAVFRDAGAVEATRLRIEVSRPLIVMVRENTEGRMIITYQDPLHQQEEREATLVLTTLEGEGESVRHELSLTLPQGIDLGRPVRMKVP